MAIVGRASCYGLAIVELGCDGRWIWNVYMGPMTGQGGYLSCIDHGVLGWASWSHFLKIHRLDHLVKTIDEQYNTYTALIILKVLAKSLIVKSTAHMYRKTSF